MTKEQILSRLLSEISDEFDKSVGSFFYDAEKPVAEILSEIYERVEEILLNGFALTASGEYLDNKVLEQGITRKSGTCSTVTVKITGNPGSSIAIGDKVASDNLIFTVTENKTLGDSGVMEVQASCDTEGTVGNIPIGAINNFPVTLPGLVSITNESPATEGFNTETDDELRERYFEKISLPATSGSKYHYEQWAKEVNGVGDAKCIPLWNGAGTVKVVIINSERGVASASLINEVAAHIEESRPIGAAVTVASATPLTIDVDATLVLENGETLAGAKAKIEDSITAYLKKNAFKNTYISFAQIGGCILNCDGIIDYSDLTLNDDTDNIEIDETEVPVLGVVTVDVETT